MATLQEIIDRATDIAAGAIDGPLQDAEMLAQSLLPEVLHQKVAESALDPYLRTIYQRTVSVTCVDNITDLPDQVMTAYIYNAEVVDENGDSASFSPLHSFLRSPDPRLAHFTIKQEHELHYLPVGGGAYNDDLEVTIPFVPEIPAAATDTIEIPEEVLDDVVRLLADKMVQSYKAVA